MVKENSKVELKEISTDDLNEVVEVHMDSFPDSALTKLGSDVLKRYYLWQLTGPHKDVRAVGAFVDGHCAGFSFSGVFYRSTSGFLDQNKAILIRKVLLRPWLLFHSFFLKRLYSGMRIFIRFNTRRRAEKEAKPTKPLPFGILSIAVSNKYQGLGIGKILMADAEKAALKCGFEQIELTVSPDNRKAIGFYENLNWKKAPVGEPWKGYMIKNLK